MVRPWDSGQHAQFPPICGRMCSYVLLKEVLMYVCLLHHWYQSGYAIVKLELACFHLLSFSRHSKPFLVYTPGNWPVPFAMIHS